MRLQYTLPVEYGPSRPSTANSIASSRWRHALGDVALVDEHAALGLERLGLEVGGAQRAAERR